MGKMIERDGVVTLRGLAKHLSATEAGLYRQPFHISLGGDHLARPIQLFKLPSTKGVSRTSSMTMLMEKEC
jgi:hypothetical protein